MAEYNGTMVGSPGVRGTQEGMDYEAVNAQMAQNVEKSQGAGSGPQVGASPLTQGGGAPGASGGGGGGGDYKSHKADFASATEGLDTLNEAGPTAPGKDPRLMSTLTGAATGAAAGVAFGPWGAVIGGVVGGAVGYFKGAKQKKEADKAYEEAMKKRKEQMALFQQAKNTSLRKFESGKTQHFMSQADSLYSSSGKNIGVARRGGIVYSPIIGVYYNDSKVERDIKLPITAKAVRKASQGAKVQSLDERVMLCSRSDGSCSLRRKSQLTPMFRRGGKLKNKFKPNIIPHGVLHEEENATGVKGDKGIPIVKGKEKMFELERSEWVLNANTSKWVEDQVYSYLKDPSDDILVSLGGKVRNELLTQTYSYDDQYAHINH